MSLTSLLQDKNSWLTLWLKENCNWANARSSAAKLNAKLSKPMERIAPVDYLLLGGSMVYAIGDLLDPTLAWLDKSPLQHANAKMLRANRAKMSLPEWSVLCSGYEKRARGGNANGLTTGQLHLPGESRDRTMEDLERLCNFDWATGDQSLVSLGKPSGLKLHQTFAFSETLGGADCQFSLESTLIRVKTTYGWITPEDLFQTAIYPALDGGFSNWETFIYLLPRQKGALQMDIKKLWTHLGFDVEAFEEVLREEDEEIDLRIQMFGD
jgi:hypothetical protein